MGGSSFVKKLSDMLLVGPSYNAWQSVVTVHREMPEGDKKFGTVAEFIWLTLLSEERHKYQDGTQ